MFLCAYDMQHKQINFKNSSEGRVTVTLECLLLWVRTGPAGGIRQGIWALFPGEERNPVWKQSREGPGAHRRHTYLTCHVRRREIVRKCLLTMCRASSHLVSQRLRTRPFSYPQSTGKQMETEKGRPVTAADKSQELVRTSVQAV